MQPCPDCKRHVRDHEVECPFCAADLPSSRDSAGGLGAVAFSALVMFGAVACSGDSVSAESGNTTTTNSGTDEDATEATTIDDTSESGMVETETDTDDGPDDTTASTGSFYAGP